MGRKFDRLGFIGKHIAVAAAFVVPLVGLYFLAPKSYSVLFFQVLAFFILLGGSVSIIYVVSASLNNFFTIPKRQRKFLLKRRMAMLKMYFGYGTTEDFMEMVRSSYVARTMMRPSDFIELYKRNTDRVTFQVWVGMLDRWDHSQHSYVARHDSTPVEVLKYLLEKGTDQVRTAVMENPNLPEEMKVYGVLLELNKVRTYNQYDGFSF